MKNLSFVSATALVLMISSTTIQAAEVCKVSMMGRVCFEEGTEAATSSHMKGDAVAEAAKKKLAADEDISKKKLAEK